jgi:hypothetical protein
MPFVWLSLGDEASSESRRGYIERNSIALLSNRNKFMSMTITIRFSRRAGPAGVGKGSIVIVIIQCAAT